MEPKLSVLLGADSLLEPRTGIGRMTFEIARQLGCRDSIADFGLLIDGNLHEKTWLNCLLQAEKPEENATDDPTKACAALPLGPSGWMKFKRGLAHYVPGVSQMHRLKTQWRLREQLSGVGVRLRKSSSLPLVYHEPNMITRSYDGPIVATINDLSWHHDANLHPIERIRWIERNFPKTLADSTRFVAISAFTRDEFVREFNVDAAKVDVVHLAPSPNFMPMGFEPAAASLARYDLADQSFILSISTLEPRKNFDRLLAAYLGLPANLRERMPLVIAGGKGWGTVLSRPDAEQAVANGQLRLLGHVPDADLVALTARCGVFVYVSLYEGFGLPVVEAMATGAAVVASSTTATGEVAGNAALLADPMNEVSIREQLQRLLEDPLERERRQVASLRHAAGFSWSKTVDGMECTWRVAAGA